MHCIMGNCLSMLLQLVRKTATHAAALCVLCEQLCFCGECFWKRSCADCAKMLESEIRRQGWVKFLQILRFLQLALVGCNKFVYKISLDIAPHFWTLMMTHWWLGEGDSMIAVATGVCSGLVLPEYRFCRWKPFLPFDWESDLDFACSQNVCKIRIALLRAREIR